MIYIYMYIHKVKASSCKLVNSPPEYYSSTYYRPYGSYVHICSPTERFRLRGAHLVEFWGTMGHLGIIHGNFSMAIPSH